MERFIRQWFSPSIWTRYGVHVWGWYQEAIVPPNLHPLSRLSWKVCSVCSFIRLGLSHDTFRVLITNVRIFGGCPCPWCLIPKDQLQDVATVNDMSQHNMLSRHDTADRCAKIILACCLIYEDQYVVNTPQVEALLKHESLVLTMVCILPIQNEFIFNLIFRTCSGKYLARLDFFSSWLSTYYMNSN